MIKSLFLAISIVLTLSIVPVSQSYAAISDACKGLTPAQIKESTVCSELVDKNGNPITDAKNPLFGADGLLNKVSLGIAVVAGSIAVIFMIIGGYKMILSNSDKQAFTNGRNTLIYAAVGLVVITIAQSLVSFVITRINN